MNPRRLFKPILNKTLVPLIYKIAPLRSLFYYIGRVVGRDGYLYLRDRFIHNGGQSAVDINLRRDIIKRFEKIDKNIPSQTSPTDGLFLAEALMSIGADGDVVECGCFCGVSSSKLSIICEILNKKLYIYDSFEGLPKTGRSNSDFSFRRKVEGDDWKTGSFASDLESVQTNIKNYGEISLCSFYKGWFNDSLTPENLPKQISFAFTDVDLPSSSRECLLSIWPLLSKRGVYFSHDIAFIKVLQEILSENIWTKELKDFPPVFIGCGSGLADSSPYLGFAVKGKNVSAEYIKSLSIDK